MKTHLDLFSGIGGFALAAGWAGYETVQFCEIDPFCQKVLRKHWPDVRIHDDIRTLTGELVGQPISLLTGGFPCQPWSVAGERRGAADDRHLWPEMARIIGEVRPRWVLGENVAGFIGMALDDCLADLESLGYEAWAVVLPACAVGAWHRRDRVWIIAHASESRRRERESHVLPRAWESNAPGSREATPNAERGGRWEPSRTDTTQGPFPPPVRQEGASRTRSGSADAADSTVITEREQADETNTVTTGGHAWSITGGRGDDAHEGRAPDDADRRRHGSSSEFIRAGWDSAEHADWWESESRLRGIPPGLSSEVDGRARRLEALGNAIVPQVAYELISAMDNAS